MADISTDDISKLSTWINGTIGMRQDFPLEDGHFIQSCWELHSELVCVFASELLLFTHVHLDFKTSTELLPYIYKPTHHYPCCVVISLFMKHTSDFVCSGMNRTEWFHVSWQFHLIYQVLFWPLCFPFHIWFELMSTNKRQPQWKTIIQTAYQACAVSCMEDNRNWVWAVTSGKCFDPVI